MPKNKSVIISVGVVAVIGLLLITAIYFGTKKNKSSQDKAVNEGGAINLEARKITVVGDNGTFTPSEITTKQQDDINLEITAVDRDYIFRIEDYPRFDTDIKMGETKTVQLYYLGVGEYNYNCGVGCTGSVVIEQSPDSEDEDL